ncbi:MAG: sugar ABC transporter permease [Oscillospiraceae bacterium]|nr:sugar ABC transporter permease [Oscillospiraceae bacterium]
MKSHKSAYVPYMFIAPHLLVFFVFLVIPTLMGMWISLHNWDYLTPAKFVGLQNYSKLFGSGIDHDNFLLGMKNTTVFVLVTVPINVTLSLVFASLLNQMGRIKNVLRLLFYFPVVLSVTCVVTTWRFLSDMNNGVINHYLKMLFGIEPIPWNTKQPYLLAILVMMTIWWTIGRNILYYIAGLTDISPQLYEASAIDGANKIQQFFHITIPGIMRVILFVTVVETIAQFNIFGQPYLYAGTQFLAEIKSARVALMVIRDTAFKEFRMGMASAMSILLGIVIIVFSSIQFKLFVSPSDK